MPRRRLRSAKLTTPQRGQSGGVLCLSACPGALGAGCMTLLPQKHNHWGEHGWLVHAGWRTRCWRLPWVLLGCCCWALPGPNLRAGLLHAHSKPQGKRGTDRNHLEHSSQRAAAAYGPQCCAGLSRCVLRAVCLSGTLQSVADSFILEDCASWTRHTLCRMMCHNRDQTTMCPREQRAPSPQPLLARQQKYKTTAGRGEDDCVGTNMPKTQPNLCNPTLLCR